jgi:hypothetical protein
MEKSGSGINIPDPQNCYLHSMPLLPIIISPGKVRVLGGYVVEAVSRETARGRLRVLYNI